METTIQGYTVVMKRNGKVHGIVEKKMETTI